METKFFDSLHNGDSANGVKLCMGITDGDFWSRSAGGQVLYKGQAIGEVDFETIEDATNVDEKFQITGGGASSRTYYIVRRVNCCGDEEKTINAVIRVEFDSLGNLIEQGCNKIINVSAEQVDGDKIKLRWFYHVINQAQKIEKFNIYSDNGIGTIDYQTPIGSVEYTGRKFYQFITTALAESHYRFCIRVVTNNNLNGEVRVWLNRQSPEGIGVIICQTI
ncbi:MAG: hypothetical protein LLF92_05350 [Planctomycetaceae bacterium]|nr:hypothetical protein [Planctomycetaceae bacterium]